MRRGGPLPGRRLAGGGRYLIDRHRVGAGSRDRGGVRMEKGHRPLRNGAVAGSVGTTGRTSLMPDTTTLRASGVGDGLPARRWDAIRVHPRLQREQVSTVAFTGALAAYLDERQYDSGFGPCVDAALSGPGITIPDPAHSPPYPDFGRVAARHGVTHTMSIGLPVPERTVGGLNVYGTGDHRFDEATQEVATAFAGYAAVAVANASVYASTASLAANLQRALESRAVIDQAKGILIGQYHISPDEAFDLLSRQSQTSNRKLRDIARDIVERAQRDTEV